MNDLRIDLLRAYTRNILTLQQYRTLIGLCNNNDEKGAKKGFEKLMRRYKRENRIC